MKEERNNLLELKKFLNERCILGTFLENRRNRIKDGYHWDELIHTTDKDFSSYITQAFIWGGKHSFWSQINREWRGYLGLTTLGEPCYAHLENKRIKAYYQSGEERDLTVIAVVPEVGITIVEGAKERVCLNKELHEPKYGKEGYQELFQAIVDQIEEGFYQMGSINGVGGHNSNSIGFGTLQCAFK